MAREFSWDLLFQQLETKRTTGSDWWQISTKSLKERFAEVNENAKNQIVNSAIPRNTQKVTQFGLSIFNGE